MSRLALGLASGAAGAVALAAADRGETALLGHPAVYAPARVASRLARRWLGRRLAPRRAGRVGAALRAAYAPALGAAAALARPALPRGRAARVAALAAAIGCAELAALPALGATPPLSRWRVAEAALLFAHAAAFAAVADAWATRRGAPPPR